MSERIYREKTCTVCGEVFTPISGAQKFCCDDCAKKARKEWQREYIRRGKQPLKTKKAESPFKPILERSKAEGISYGQAVAKIDQEAGVNLVSHGPGFGSSDDLRKNGEGYYDPTPYQAIKRLEKWDEEGEKFGKLLHTIFTMCDLAGFEIQGRITVKSKETGRLWK